MLANELPGLPLLEFVFTFPVAVTPLVVPLNPSNMTAALSIADLTNFDYSVTSGSLSPSEGSISATVTVTPKSGFTADAGDKSETLTISGDDLGANIELALNAEVKAKHDIIFDTDLKSIANVSVMEGETYNITETIEAALIASCTYTKFEGWTTAASIADPSVKPSLVSSVTMSTADVTLKPVFSKTIASGGINGSTIIDYSKLGLGSYGDGTGKDTYSWSYTKLTKGSNNTIQGNSSKSSFLYISTVPPHTFRLPSKNSSIKARCFSIVPRRSNDGEPTVKANVVPTLFRSDFLNKLKFFIILIF